jgi:hypothetical protein
MLQKPFCQDSTTNLLKEPFSLQEADIYNKSTLCSCHQIEICRRIYNTTYILANVSAAFLIFGLLGGAENKIKKLVDGSLSCAHSMELYRKALSLVEMIFFFFLISKNFIKKREKTPCTLGVNRRKYKGKQKSEKT